MKAVASRSGRFDWLIVLGALIAVYLVINQAAPHVVGGFARAYIVGPVLWSLLAVLVVIVSRRGGGDYLQFSRKLLLIAVLVGLFHVACLVVAGLFFGFGNTPYARSPYGMFLNLCYFGTMLVGLEFSRAYLLGRFRESHPVLMLGFTALLYTAVMIPTNTIAIAKDPLAFAGGTCLPLVSENLLGSLLALLGGPVAVIVYRGILDVFEWFSPILPDLKWIVAAFAGTLAPVFGFLVVQGLYGEPERKDEVVRRRSSRGALIGWGVTGLLVVGLLAATFGVMGLRPMVIVSGSMTPSICVGDVVLVKQVPVEQIKENDVIQFVQRGPSVVHRVVEVGNGNDSPYFVTKGDALDHEDFSPVYADEVRGKVSLTIPKVGWVSIGIKDIVSRIL